MSFSCAPLGLFYLSVNVGLQCRPSSRQPSNIILTMDPQGGPEQSQRERENVAASGRGQVGVTHAVAQPLYL